MGIQWPFRRLIASGVAEAGSMRNSWAAQRALLSPKSQTVAAQKKAALRARDSVQRGSDFVQIAITPTMTPAQT
jgi:hypothetical protein